MRFPKVSVIIPTYNYSSVLRYAVATVLWQTFRDFELIVVGDGCTDDSEAVVRSFADERVRWINLSENSGAKYVPLNTGIAAARASLIAYLEHDNLWHPRHLETLVSALAREQADVAYSVMVYVPPPGESLRVVSGIIPEGDFRSGYCLNGSSVVHQRSLISDVGGWDDHRTSRMPPDHVFFSRAAEAGKRFVGVPKLTVWKFNASSRPGCYRDQRCDEQARYFDMIRDDPALAEKELVHVARSAMLHGLEPLRMRKESRDAPPGSYIHHLRQVRGLEPSARMEPLPFSPEEAPFRVAFATAVPGEVHAGETIELEVRIENGSEFQLSSEAPHPVHCSYHWLHSDGSAAIVDGLRSSLIPPLPACSTLHYYITIVAPVAPGMYSLRLALVQEEICWFDQTMHAEPPTVCVISASVPSQPLTSRPSLLNKEQQ